MKFSQITVYHNFVLFQLNFLLQPHTGIIAVLNEECLRPGKVTEL